jgi:hypothetical protein
MRLLVRATTIRAPTGPPLPRIYGLGRDRDSGSATATIDLQLSASGNDSDRGSAEWSDPSTETARGRDNDRGSATFLFNSGASRGTDNDSGSATVRRVFPGTDNDRGRASARFGARGTDNDRGQATASNAIAYEWQRTLIIERQADVGADTMADYPFRFTLTGAWLKQANLTGGRIRNANALDLIVETTAATPVRLDHEIDSYDGTNGIIYLTVRIPSWNRTVDQVRIRLRYGATL